GAIPRRGLRCDSSGCSIRSSRRWSTASMCCSASGGCTRTTALSASSARREEHMAITNTTVSQTYPRFQSLVYPTVTPHAKTLTTAGGAQTLTAAELLGGLLLINCDDAQTLNLPSAADLNAAIPGVAEGTAFVFSVINH